MNYRVLISSISLTLFSMNIFALPPFDADGGCTFSFSQAFTNWAQKKDKETQDIRKYDRKSYLLDDSMFDF